MPWMSPHNKPCTAAAADGDMVVVPLCACATLAPARRRSLGPHLAHACVLRPTPLRACLPARAQHMGAFGYPGMAAGALGRAPSAPTFFLDPSAPRPGPMGGPMPPMMPGLMPPGEQAGCTVELDQAGPMRAVACEQQ